MFELENGREHFYQWDTNQRIIINDNTVIEAHFCNRTDECSLVCEAYTDGGKRLVDVPNILLQDNLDIRVYAYCGNYTKVEQRYKVIKRTKPADYVYTETEVKRYEDLESRIKAVEEKEVDLSGYYTKAEVDTAIENVEVDLSEYYTKTEVDTAIEENAITPDWEAQEGEPGYIANKTHGITKGFIDILPPTTTSLEMEGAILTPLTNPLEVGQKAIVNYNGTEYECNVFEYTEETDDGIITVNVCGNPALMNIGEDNGIPFMFMEAPAALQAQGVYAMFVPIDYFESGDATISVKAEGTVIKKIDDKYLPRYDWNAEPNTEGYIANRTHYTANVGTLVYDAANLAGVERVSLPNGLTLYKVSDYVLDKDTFSNTILYTADTASGDKTERYQSISNNEDGYVLAYSDNIIIISSSKTNTDIITLPSTGTFIFPAEYNYVELVVGEMVKKLDAKYIDTTELLTQDDLESINADIETINADIAEVKTKLPAQLGGLAAKFTTEATGKFVLIDSVNEGIYKSMRIKIVIPKVENANGGLIMTVRGANDKACYIVDSKPFSTTTASYITCKIDGDSGYIDVIYTPSNGYDNLTHKEVITPSWNDICNATTPIKSIVFETYAFTEGETVVFPANTVFHFYGGVM